MAIQSFHRLAGEILARPCPHVVRLIGVDGAAGSGKSTFASALARALGGAPIIPIDDFLAWDDLQDFWPRFEAQVLEPLFAGKDLRYQMRDWLHDNEGRGLGEWRELAFSPVVILEGIGATRRQLGSRLHYSVWVQADAELRLARGLARDGEQARGLWEGFMPGEADFFEADGARGRADLVVDGCRPYEGEGGRSFHVIPATGRDS